LYPSDRSGKIIRSSKQQHQHQKQQQQKQQPASSRHDN